MCALRVIRYNAAGYSIQVGLPIEKTCQETNDCQFPGSDTNPPKYTLSSESPAVIAWSILFIISMPLLMYPTKQIFPFL